jgi:hypothetical protein
MTKKVFISYSHKDELHREDLDEHLAMLQRSNVISVWHDRKLTAGDDWKQNIDENLEAADIILFLVSPSFLASPYCYDVEVKKAMEKHDEGSAKIISIILRPCDWMACDFSRFQAVPKDALAITLWPNKDSAWLDAINGIKNYISSFTPTIILQSGLVKESATIISKEVFEWLEDTEVVLTHRKVDKVKLSDIYVSPDLEGEDINLKDIKVFSSDKLHERKGRYLISGEEQQGKTTLLKNIYKQLIKAEYFVIYLDEKEINKAKLEFNLESAIKSQYQNLDIVTFLSFDKKAILLDNIDEIGLNLRFRANFLDQVNSLFDYSLITCHSSFGYISSEIKQLETYERVEVLGLGHHRRAQIVEKWISLGIEESIDDKELYTQADELKARLDAVIRKNIVPPKPIYVLVLVQMFEVYAQQNLELTSHGHCYQQLIYRAFDSAGISANEIEKYLNVLTEFAWDVYLNGKGLNEHQLDNFFIEYNKTYLSVDQKVVIEKLLSNSILIDRDNYKNFKYPYFFYFFAAKKIAESFSNDDFVKSEVRNLLGNLHREDYANILVFVTHHTKDLWLLKEIEDVLGALFSEHQPATLSREQLKFMDDFIAQIPELILEQREIRLERESHNKKLDEIETQGDENFEANDTLANINKTFKGMEIVGQIIRNRHAALTRDSLFDLANQGALTGLRFLDHFIYMTDVAKAEVIKFITNKLREHPNLTDEDIEKYAKNAFLHLTFGVINGVIKKIASSIGSKEAAEIYAELAKRENSPAVILLNEAIELQFNKRLDAKSVALIIEKLKDNPVCIRILKEMVVQHTYMFPVDYVEKQKLAEMLGISVKGQRLMDFKKIGKG